MENFFFFFFYEARKKVILEMSKRLRRTITLRFCLDYFSPNILRSGREGGDFSSQYLGGREGGGECKGDFLSFFSVVSTFAFLFAHYLSFIVEDRPQLPLSLRKKEKKIKTQRKQTWLQKQKTNKQTNFS